MLAYGIGAAQALVVKPCMQRKGVSRKEREIHKWVFNE
jgi:hypothetical protein